MAKIVLRLGEVADTLGLSVPTIKRLRQDPEAKFPAPVRLGVRAVGWLASDLEAWAASRRAA